MRQAPLASEGGGAASGLISGERHRLGDTGAGRFEESTGRLEFIPDQCVCLEEAARTAGSVICGSLQFQGGVWGANVLTGEQASRLRSSYVTITQACWDAFQPGKAGDDMARLGERA